MAWVALGTLMMIASALILYLGRGLTFLRDEWIFVIYRDGNNATNFLSNHAGHLVLWPVAFFIFMFKAVGLDHYDLYRLATLPGHLACALLVFLLARRRIGDIAAVAPAGVLLFLGSAWMDILWPFQIGFTGALAFGLAAILFLERDDLKGDSLSCLSLLIAIGWSGAALPFFPGVAAGLMVRRRFWKRSWVIAAPALVYLAWSHKYGDHGIDYAANLSRAPAYALKMAGEGITGIIGLPDAVGPYLALALALIVAVRLWRLGRSSPLAWEALSMALAFWAVTAIARAQENDPTAGRYIYPSAVFLLLLTVGLAPLGEPRRLAIVAIFTIAMLTLASNLADFGDGRDELLFTSNITSAELGALQLARNVVAPEYAPELDGFSNAVPAASFFAATDRYASSPADSPQEIASSPDYARRRADATSIAALRVRMSDRALQPDLAGSPPSLRAVSGVVSGLREGCATLSGPGRVEAIGMVPHEGVSIESAKSAVTVALRRFAAGFHRLRQAVPPSSERFLRIAPDAERERPWRLRVVAHSGPIRVCRAGGSRSG